MSDTLKNKKTIDFSKLNLVEEKPKKTGSASFDNVKIIEGYESSPYNHPLWPQRDPLDNVITLESPLSEYEAYGVTPLKGTDNEARLQRAKQAEFQENAITLGWILGGLILGYIVIQRLGKFIKEVAAIRKPESFQEIVNRDIQEAYEEMEEEIKSKPLLVNYDKEEKARRKEEGLKALEEAFDIKIVREHEQVTKKEELPNFGPLDSKPEMKPNYALTPEEMARNRKILFWVALGLAAFSLLAAYSQYA